MSTAHKPTRQGRNPLPRMRLGLVAALLAVGLVGVTAKTLYLQLFRQPTLAEWAQQQQQDEQVLTTVRGDILDRNGQELAVGEERISFYATPRLVKDVAVAADTIARILKFDPREKDELVTQLSREDTGFVYVERKVPRKIADKLIAERLDGIGYVTEEQRIYPLGTVASQVVGYAGMDNEGLSGVELMFDNSLRGRPGRQVLVRDPGGTPLDVLEVQREIDGRDVTLTIDATMQMYAERILKRTVQSYDAKAATAIVLDPRTGEVLVMANVPTVDSNNAERTPQPYWRNRAITDLYEPGSTYKAVTVAGALEDGVVEPHTSFLLQPTIQVADRKIKNSHRRPTMRMSVSDILIQSDNVGTITVGMLLGKERLDYWMRRFGFGEPTNIDFPGEENGIVLEPEDWSGSTIGNVPIGQGLAVTPIQLVAAYSAIANNGVLVQPHLLKRVGTEQPQDPPTRRVISARTAKQVQKMLGQVVTDERGTGKTAQITGYTVAGKTGTANKAEQGVYVKGKYVASFIGFVPAHNPQLLALVVVDEPSTPWGGTVAAPAFEQIVSFGLQYLAIAPDGVR